MENLLAVIEIKDLLVRERYYRDRQQWAKLRQCYHSDPSKTQIKISWYSGDINGFIAGSQKMALSSGNASHTISPVEVHLNGDRAVSESTGTILARFTHERRVYDCVSYGQFISRLERENSKWKLLSLEVIYDKDLIQPVLPEAAMNTISLDPAWRPSYQCLTWVLSKNGFSIDQTLPGTDVGGSGERQIAACLNWLEDI
ncbi:hypothetical protein K4F52_006406 [Lecanicillium sp. MT-2017a]|nr:hypothetical protein K4F52_006406 [Lecanicillium sp. MT-2017a]